MTWPQERTAMPQHRAPLERMRFVIEQVLDAPARWTRLARKAPAHPLPAQQWRWHSVPRSDRTLPWVPTE